MEIWTVDVFNYGVKNFLNHEVDGNGKQKLMDWDTHPHFRAMQKVRFLLIIVILCFFVI